MSKLYKIYVDLEVERNHFINSFYDVIRQRCGYEDFGLYAVSYSKSDVNEFMKLRNKKLFIVKKEKVNYKEIDHYVNSDLYIESHHIMTKTNNELMDISLMCTKGERDFVIRELKFMRTSIINCNDRPYRKHKYFSLVNEKYADTLTRLKYGHNWQSDEFLIDELTIFLKQNEFLFDDEEE